MKTRTKKILILLVKVLVSLIIIFYFFSKIEISAYLEILHKTNLFYFFIGAVFYMLGLFVFTYKWQILVNMMSVPSRYWRLFRMNLISFFYAIFLPGGFLAGETVKCYKITKNEEHKTRRFFSVLLDRITGAVAFTIIGAISLLISGYYRSDILLLYAIIVFATVLIFFILINKHIRIFIKNIFCKFLPLLRERLANSEEMIRNKNIYIAIGLGIMFQLIITGGLFFLIKSLGFNISFINLIWINALVSVVTMMPVSFLGIGLRDFSLVYLLSQFGFSVESCLSIATLVVFVLLLRGIPGGLLELKNYFY